MIYHNITKNANGQLLFLTRIAKTSCKKLVFTAILCYNLFTSSIALGNCSSTFSTTTFGTMPILSIQVPLGV